MKYNVVGGEMSYKEINAYMDILQKKYPERLFREVTFKVDGDYVDVDYTYDTVPFERIRRITGYLVGNMTRWNNGKRAEEHDRVKHTV
ncbi:MAG: hypothetical protein K6F80_04035 [Oscillospiraceae bacterium]|nr:hypothetical protein [Oscillospiraceae bacterium]